LTCCRHVTGLCTYKVTAILHTSACSCRPGKGSTDSRSGIIWFLERHYFWQYFTCHIRDTDCNLAVSHEK